MLASDDFGSAVRVWGLPAEGESAATATSPVVRPIPTTLPLSPMAISLDNVDRLTTRATADQAGVQQIVFAPDGPLFATTGDPIRFFESPTLERLSTVLPGARAIAYSSDGQVLASTSYDGIRLFGSSDGRELVTFPGSNDSSIVAFSPDGSVLASVSGQTVKLWDVTDGRELRTLPAGPSQANVAFSPNGKLLAAASGVAGTDLKVWNTRTWEEVHTLTGHQNSISCIRFSPDGQTLATGAYDHSIRLWDMQSGLMVRKIDIPDERSGQIPDMTFSPNGELLVSTYGEPLISVWSVSTGAELNLDRTHRHGQCSVVLARWRLSDHC